MGDVWNVSFDVCHSFHWEVMTLNSSLVAYALVVICLDLKYHY